MYFFAYLIKLLYIIQIPLFHLLENCFRFALYTLLFTVWKHYSICWIYRCVLIFLMVQLILQIQMYHLWIYIFFNTITYILPSMFIFPEMLIVHILWVCSSVIVINELNIIASGHKKIFHMPYKASNNTNQLSYLKS